MPPVGGPVHPAKDSEAVHPDADRFRSVLGHFPTGVVLVTSLSANGDPAGMVVGSFTSVSMNPALVAFLPSKTSNSYKDLDLSSGFVVNVLSDNQQWICRQFSAKKSEDKWKNVEWRQGELGLPILSGSLAWIECETEITYDGGDHDIVLGRVVALQASKQEQHPLLFFQGGYGHFSSLSLQAALEPDLVKQLRIADLARDEMEYLSAQLGLECMAQAAVRDQLVHIASAVGGRDNVHTRVGTRVPFRPPFGALHVAWSDRDHSEGWLSRASARGPEQREKLQGALSRVRERGYTLSVFDQKSSEMSETILAFSQSADSEIETRLRQLMDEISGSYEPEEIGEIEDVRAIGAPIFEPDGSVSVTLKLLADKLPIPSEDLARCRDLLLQACQRVSERVAMDLPRQ